MHRKYQTSFSWPAHVSFFFFKPGLSRFQSSAQYVSLLMLTHAACNPIQTITFFPILQTPTSIYTLHSHVCSHSPISASTFYTEYTASPPVLRTPPLVHVAVTVFCFAFDLSFFLIKKNTHIPQVVNASCVCMDEMHFPFYHVKPHATAERHPLFAPCHLPLAQSLVSDNPIRSHHTTRHLTATTPVSNSSFSSLISVPGKARLLCKVAEVFFLAFHEALLAATNEPLNLSTKLNTFRLG